MTKVQTSMQLSVILNSQQVVGVRFQLAIFSGACKS